MRKLFQKAGMLFALVLSLSISCRTTVSAENVLAFTKPLTIGTPVSGELLDTAKDCKYTITIPRSGALTIQLGFKEGSGYSFGWLGTATLYDADDKSIREISIRDNSGGTDSDTFTADLMAGNYYLYISTAANDHASSKYVLSSSFVDSNETVVDSVANPHDSQANPIAFTLNKTFTGHLAVNGADDVYSLNVSKDCMLHLNIANHTNGVRYQVINATNTVNVDDYTSDKAINRTIFCPKGKYYITVSRQYDNGTYTITAKATDLATTQIKKVKNKKGRIMSVKFGLKSENDARGFQIQYATDKKFKKGKKTVNIENNGWLKSTYDIAVKKKTYYVRIRTYMTDNRGDAYYSKWSNAKKVVIKK